VLLSSDSDSKMSSDDTSTTTVVDRHAVLIVRGAIIGTGLVGLALLARSSRLFTKFSQVYQIPDEYMRTEMRLRGRVRTVEPDGALHVEHIPILPLPRIMSRHDKNESTLTLRLAGIELTPAGRTFVDELALVGKRIDFTPIKLTPRIVDSVDCQVMVRKHRFLRTNLNVELTRRGLARVLGPEIGDHLTALQTIPAYSRLVNQLLVSEKIADHRGIGMWQRESWVESLNALPSQLAELIRTSTIVRLLMLTSAVAVDLLIAAGRLARDACYVGWKLTRYLYVIYRRLAVTIDRLYVNYKRRRVEN